MRKSIHISSYLDLNRNQTAILLPQPPFDPLDNRDLLALRHQPQNTKSTAAVAELLKGGFSKQEITAFDAPQQV